MNPIRVVVINWTHNDDQWLADGVDALQRQLRDDFAPTWHVDAELAAVPRDEAMQVYPDHWALVLLGGPGLEELEQAALGEFAAPSLTCGGLPLARVFLDSLPAGHDWTHPASHALLEMLIDPNGDATVACEGPDCQHPVYAKRVCDPCAAYSDGYERGGRHVSDFVYPAWFGAASGTAGTFDRQRHIGRPFQVLPGGTAGVRDTSGSSWTVLDSDGQPVVDPLAMPLSDWPPTQPLTPHPDCIRGLEVKAGWGP